METIQILRKILGSSDACSAVLREALWGFSIALLLLAISYPLSKRYFRSASDASEKKKRVIGFFAPLFTSVFGFYGWMFSTACGAPPGCGRMFDLNCEGSLPVVYLAMMTLGFSCACVLAIYETVRVCRARGV
jgi:Na+/proline symporter